MHFFTELNDHGCFYRFPKALIRDRVWSGLPHAAQAVLPAIGCFANPAGVAFPSEETIAAVCGCTEKTVRVGVSALADFHGLRIEKYTTARGRLAKRFVFTRQPSGAKSFFAFHRRIIDGGHWSELLPAGKALYPVMRYFSFYDRDDLQAAVDESDKSSSSDEAYKVFFSQRRHEFCDAELSVLADLAGVARRSLSAALADLDRCALIERDGSRWKVWIRPEKYFLRDFLNKKLQSGRR